MLCCSRDDVRQRGVQRLGPLVPRHVGASQHIVAKGRSAANKKQQLKLGGRGSRPGRSRDQGTWVLGGLARGQPGHRGRILGWHACSVSRGQDECVARAAPGPAARALRQPAQPPGADTSHLMAPEAQYVTCTPNGSSSRRSASVSDSSAALEAAGNEARRQGGWQARSGRSGAATSNPTQLQRQPGVHGRAAAHAGALLCSSVHVQQPRPALACSPPT